MNPQVIIGAIAALIIIVMGVTMFLGSIGVVDPDLAWYAAAMAFFLKVLEKVIKAMRPRQVAGEPKEKGKKPTIVSIVFLLLFISLAWGCGPILVKGQKLSMDLWMGPPCRVKVYMDGKLIQESEATKMCIVTEEVKELKTP